MRAVVLIGSAALGDYVAGMSDLDLAVVAPGPIDDPEAVAGSLRHAVLPCPARKLELVVYRAEQAAAPGPGLRFELDLNTGPRVDRLVTEPGDGGNHWYLIDLAIAHEHGVSLAGPPAREVIGAPARADLLDALREGLRWARKNEPDTPGTVLNACRAWRYAERGDWVSKPAAREWAATAHGGPADLVERAAAALERAR
jgi:hypothetical protein